MTKNIALAAFLALSAGCVFIDVNKGNGDLVEETRDVAAFTGVINEGPIAVHVVSGTTASVIVSCDSNLIDDIETDVENGNLIIGNRDGINLSFRPSDACFVEVVAVDLDRVAGSGSGALVVDGEGLQLTATHNSGSGALDVLGSIVADEFEATNTGSGASSFADIDANDVSLETTGSGSLTVSGGATIELEIDVTGSGSIHARALGATSVDAEVNGSGSGEVTAFEAIEAETTGSGGLSVWGDPTQRNVNSTGSGSVTFEE